MSTSISVSGGLAKGSGIKKVGFQLRYYLYSPIIGNEALGLEEVQLVDTWCVF